MCLKHQVPIDLFVLVSLVVKNLKRIPGGLLIFFAKTIHHCYQWDMSAENPLACQHVQNSQRNNQNKCWCLPKNPDCQNIFLGFVINCQNWFWTVIFLLLLKVFPLSNRKPTCVSVSSQVILCGKFQVATVHRTMSRSLWIESRLFRTSV